MNTHTVMKLNEIKPTLLGRHELDDGNVERLMEAIKGGAKLPITIIDGSADVFNGGHTLEAYLRLGHKEAPVEFRKSRGAVNDAVDALKANAGGSLPPSRNDFLATIGRMMSSGAKEGEIVKKIAGARLLEAKTVRTYCRIIKKKRNQTAMQKALAAVAEDTKPADAALKFHVDLSKLKARIGGRKKPATDAAELSEKLAAISRSFSQKRSYHLREIGDAVTQGSIELDSGIALHEQAIKLAEKGVDAAKSALASFQKANSLPTTHRKPRKDRGRKRKAMKAKKAS